MDELREIENAAVLDAIRLQEDANLDILADGEMHRTGWAGARFYLEGFSSVEGATSSYPANVGQCRWRSVYDTTDARIPLQRGHGEDRGEEGRLPR